MEGAWGGAEGAQGHAMRPPPPPFSPFQALRLLVAALLVLCLLGRATADPRLTRADGGAARPNARLEAAAALFRAGVELPDTVAARPLAVSLLAGLPEGSAAGGGRGGFVARPGGGRH